MARTAHNKTSDEKECSVVQLYEDMYSPKYISKQLGISKSLVDRILKRRGITRKIKTSASKFLTQKRCLTCLQVKGLEEFKKIKRMIHGKHSGTCKKCEYAKQIIWRANNREKQREKDRKWAKAKRAQSTQYKVSQNIRRRIREIVRFAYATKHDTSMRLVGCSVEELISHLESKFKHGMSWSNYGPNGWHIDHIIPCASFDMSKEDDQRKCFHWTNLQPLWASENCSKCCKV